ncbi:hypothetical protein KIN20_002402 [Parelaphostrongylus tenuis]|uniref:Uncharacterized protein n=1 Tax=Parelaphostrongylus tenuis TaxID=148309 RepID=A0AAD5QHR8_PARTN|nr:hypothetical protein KIN20_002402 [Parelaphostrongylus tenuis]
MTAESDIVHEFNEPRPPPPSPPAAGATPLASSSQSGRSGLALTGCPPPSCGEINSRWSLRYVEYSPH